MKEDLESQDLETVSEEVNQREDTLKDVFEKCVEALEVVEKALGIGITSYDQAVKLPSKELTQLEPEQKFVSNQSENLSKYEHTTTEKLAQQKYDLAELKVIVLNGKNLKKWSRDLKAKSQQLMAKSTELRIYSEDLVARSRNDNQASKNYQLPGGAPMAHRPDTHSFLTVFVEFPTFHFSRANIKMCLDLNKALHV